MKRTLVFILVALFVAVYAISDTGMCLDYDCFIELVCVAFRLGRSNAAPG